MNPRQRRGLLVVLVGLVAVTAAFVSVARYTRDVARQVGPMRPVLELSRDVPAHSPLSGADVEVVRVPERFVSPTSVSDVADLERRVAGVALMAGSYLQASDLVDPPGAEPGQRVISLVVDLESGVAGQLDPDDYVDVIAAGSAGDGDRVRARTVVRDVRVLTAQPVDGQQGVVDVEDGESGGGGAATIAVTLAVSPAQARMIVLADTTASSMRLVLVPRVVAGAVAGTATP